MSQILGRTVAAFILAGTLSTAGFILPANAQTMAQLTAEVQKADSAGVTSFHLENGLEVVVIPDHRAPVVTHTRASQVSRISSNT
jgi:zinc protease